MLFCFINLFKHAFISADHYCIASLHNTFTVQVTLMYTTLSKYIFIYIYSRIASMHY